MSDTNDTLKTVLDYVSSPFKLFAILVLSIVGFVGYFVYANQGVMLGAYLHSRDLPKLDDSKFDDAAALLFKETGAEVVTIFTVNPIVNSRILVRAYSKSGGRQKALEGTEVKLFTNNAANNNDVVKLMAGEVPCGAYTRAQSIAGLYYLSQGSTFVCRISSPSAKEQFVGQISVAWQVAPDLEHARSIMTIASDLLVR